MVLLKRIISLMTVSFIVNLCIFCSNISNDKLNKRKRDRQVDTYK
jgi:hypothetical protein